MAKIIFMALFGLSHATVFDDLLSEFWEWRLRDNPEFASNVGDSRYTELVEDYSLEAIDARKDWLERFLAKVKSSIIRKDLSKADQITYDVLDDTIQAWLDGYEWKNYGPMNPVSRIDGFHYQYDRFAGQVKFHDVSSFKNFAARIRAFGDQIDQVIVRMNVSIHSKTTLNNVSISEVPAALDKILQFKTNVTAFPMFEPFLIRLDAKTSNTTEKALIRALAKTNIEYLLQKIERLKQFITEDYLRHTRTSDGVWGLPRGLEYYRASLKWQLSEELDPEYIHKTGLAEVERIIGEMEMIMRRDGFNGSLHEYFAVLRQNQSNFESDPDKALQAFKDMHRERILPVLDQFFEDIPDVPLEIKRMTNNGPLGIYKNAAPDGSRPGVFYANVDYGPVAKYTMASLLVHETDPGHHLQDAYALTNPAIPMFRRAVDYSKYFAAPMHFPFYTAYCEGWGLYSEELGDELGVYQNDYDRLGKFNQQIFRAARLVVDTGLHALQWSRADAIGYMLDNTALARASIEREIDRYITWPGQATAYTIGNLKVIELRRRATIRTCGFFDVKKFHSVLLKNGALPMSVLDTLVDDWVAEVRQKHGISGSDCPSTVSSAATTTAAATLTLHYFMLLFYFVTNT
ncbi:uncharacterized protein LOC127842723 isoform X1 [Dreissena polymorpha]|uniref:uncharacterized protein LOC127842723 isoform X1 n=1 Tax=Dreissena polymorpha TaxID=45954 RepID=UPI0022643FA9|nr:uncharacterized protein LOC127842723 isoform X1 [Dreissena polymorpha]